MTTNRSVVAFVLVAAVFAGRSDAQTSAKVNVPPNVIFRPDLVYSRPNGIALMLILRQQGLMIHGLRVRQGNWMTEMAYHFLASSSKDSWHPDGEVQIFADYMERVGAAKQARQMFVENPNQAVISETMQENISRERDRIKSRRKLRNRRRIARGKLFRAEHLGIRQKND